MPGLKTDQYIVRSGLTQKTFADSLGRTRQCVWNWIRDGATVELTDIGIIVRAKNGRILHESQVAK